MRFFKPLLAGAALLAIGLPALASAHDDGYGDRYGYDRGSYSHAYRDEWRRWDHRDDRDNWRYRDHDRRHYPSWRYDRGWHDRETSGGWR